MGKGIQARTRDGDTGPLRPYSGSGQAGARQTPPPPPGRPPPRSPAPGFPPLENEPDRWPASRTRRDNARTCTPEVAAAASGVPSSCAPRPRVPAGRS